MNKYEEWWLSLKETKRIDITQFCSKTKKALDMKKEKLIRYYFLCTKNSQQKTALAFKPFYIGLYSAKIVIFTFCDNKLQAHCEPLG